MEELRELSKKLAPMGVRIKGAESVAVTRPMTWGANLGNDAPAMQLLLHLQGPVRKLAKEKKWQELIPGQLLGGKPFLHLKKPKSGPLRHIGANHVIEYLHPNGILILSNTPVTDETLARLNGQIKKLVE